MDSSTRPRPARRGRRRKWHRRRLLLHPPSPFLGKAWPVALPAAVGVDGTKFMATETLLGCRRRHGVIAQVFNFTVSKIASFSVGSVRILGIFDSSET